MSMTWAIIALYVASILFVVLCISVSKLFDRLERLEFQVFQMKCEQKEQVKFNTESIGKLIDELDFHMGIAP